MRNKSFNLVLGLIFVVLFAGCVKSADTKKPSSPINHVALVSFSVANWHGMVTGTAGSTGHAAELINSGLSALVTTTESKLSGVMRVTKVSSFVGSPGYRGLGVKNDLEILLPRVGGQPMAVFVKENDDLIAAKLPSDVAKKLCATLKVDAVVVIYSEWAAAQGHFVPTRRALAKDVVSVWDRNGNLVFNKRVDETGDAVIGGPYGPIVVNEGTIQQWSQAYNKAIDQIIPAMKSLK
jgi:hypothetical protein